MWLCVKDTEDVHTQGRKLVLGDGNILDHMQG